MQITPKPSRAVYTRQVNFRVTPELYTQFSAACDSQSVLTADVLRHLMAQFVAQMSAAGEQEVQHG